MAQHKAIWRLLARSDDTLDPQAEFFHIYG